MHHTLSWIWTIASCVTWSLPFWNKSSNDLHKVAFYWPGNEGEHKKLVQGAKVRQKKRWIGGNNEYERPFCGVLLWEKKTFWQSWRGGTHSGPGNGLGDGGGELDEVQSLLLNPGQLLLHFYFHFLLFLLVFDGIGSSVVVWVWRCRARSGVWRKWKRWVSWSENSGKCQSCAFC